MFRVVAVHVTERWFLGYRVRPHQSIKHGVHEQSCTLAQKESEGKGTVSRYVFGFRVEIFITELNLPVRFQTVDTAILNRVCYVWYHVGFLHRGWRRVGWGRGGGMMVPFH